MENGIVGCEMTCNSFCDGEYLFWEEYKSSLKYCMNGRPTAADFKLLVSELSRSRASLSPPLFSVFRLFNFAILNSRGKKF